MPQHLLLSVRMHDGRYHGMNEWRPSPARLFQALVAGPTTSQLSADDVGALQWLERLAPPIVGTPMMRLGQRITSYVPDNDIDTVDGDLDRVAEIRSGKVIQPRLFDQLIPFLFAWELNEDLVNARLICEIANQLYQFGRGVDMAWACGELVDEKELEDRLSVYPGHVARPSLGNGSTKLRCPTVGSFASLEARHRAFRQRFVSTERGQLFVQPPKPYFADVAYNAGPNRQIYELREETAASGFRPWPLRRAVQLVIWMRDAAVAKLTAALPSKVADVRRAMVGRQPDGTDAIPMASRVRIIPLPSIGHEHADRGIRRVLVEVPAECPLGVADVGWAFSSLHVSDPSTGEVFATLNSVSDETMLRHYGVAEHDHNPATVWRTVTPTALTAARRRRIDPSRRAEEAKGGSERLSENAQASHAVRQALRHVDLHAAIKSVRVQREPFDRKGQRAEAFAPGTRFEKERLWHVEIEFSSPIEGPLIFGDGRFMGLGLCRPVRASSGVFAFHIRGGLRSASRAQEVCGALRRAVMSRVQERLGRGKMPAYFSGHDDFDGARARDHHHLSFVFDRSTSRLFVIAPHVLQRRNAWHSEREHEVLLLQALQGFRELRAGRSGLLKLDSAHVDLTSDPLFAPSQRWKSTTTYRATRHARRLSCADALVADVLEESRRAGLPVPRVTVIEAEGGTSRRGLKGRVELAFETAVRGPLLLGRTRHMGGGAFVVAGPDGDG